MEKSTGLLHWLPRGLCIVAIVFISMFAFDVFDPEHTIWQQIGGLLIHLIPSFVLLLLLIVAWKWENIGGIIFIALGIIFSPIIFIKNYQLNQSILTSLVIILLITFPFILIGVFFLKSYYKKKKDAFEK